MSIKPLPSQSARDESQRSHSHSQHEVFMPDISHARTRIPLEDWVFALEVNGFFLCLFHKLRSHFKFRIWF